MKTCSYCGRDNEDALAACRGCGTEFRRAEPATPSAPLSWSARITIALVPLFALATALVAMPFLLLAIPFFALFYLPIYLPLVLSFFIKAHEWRVMRWCLRIATLAAVFIRLIGMSSRPDFGDDVAGNIAGASHNFAWTWGSGFACGIVALIIGLLLRSLLARHSRGASERVSSV